ncbi:MAG: hypothetical protein R3F34_06705 [Planctomycetota bacterium]
MTRGLVLLLHLANLAVAGSGALWAWMLWFVEPVDEFALQNHPLEDEMQAAHVLAAPLLVFALGMTVAVHALPHLRGGTRARRRTGILLLATAGSMSASGYLLQVAVSEDARDLLVLLHVATSVLWCAGLVLHLATRATSESSAPA